MQSTEPTKVSGWMGKYRSIIFAIGLFIVFDLAVLTATFFASHQIAEDTAALNLVNRQRMLSQQIAKSIHIAESDQVASQPSAGSLKELKSVTALFDATHRGFRVGGAGEDNAGQEVRIKALDDVGQQDLLKQIAVLWTPYVALIDPLTGSSVPATETIRKAADYSRANSTKILNLLSQLSAQIEAGVKEKINALRTIQFYWRWLIWLTSFLYSFESFARPIA
jgi:two-component system, chemotaxis family, sensor kinase CheA